MSEPVPEPAGALVERLLDVSGEVSYVILFGSRLVQASPDEHSAYDLVVAVRDARRFYGDFVARVGHRRPAWLLHLLGRILPPNVMAFDPPGGGSPRAKLLLLTDSDFLRALGSSPRDHFVKGRMSQHVAVLYARSAESRADLESRLHRSRADVFRWAGPYLEEPFTVESLTLRMLEVSYRGEIRPESADRVREVWEVQRDWLTEAYGRVVAEAEAAGRLVKVPGGWRLSEPPGRLDALRSRAYFLRSKIRATLRWSKYVLTYDDWLSYIQRKVERRTGMTVQLTEWERRLPLLLLWPKVFHVLRNRPERHLRKEPDNGESP